MSTSLDIGGVVTKLPPPPEKKNVLTNRLWFLFILYHWDFPTGNGIFPVHVPYLFTVFA